MGKAKTADKTDFSIKHPLLYTGIIYIVSFFCVLCIMVVGSMVGIPQNFTNVFGRILVAGVLLYAFRDLFSKEKFFTGIPIGLPALIFVLWNVVYNLLTNGQLASAAGMVSAVFEGLAPAMFEETIFRGIAVSKMEQSGRKPMETLILTALLFGVLHLTNIAGMSLINVLVQAGYAFVIGLVFSAVFIVSHDIVTVILLHALIDISNNMFVPGGSATVVLLCVFGVLMAVMAVYAVYLVKTIEKEGSSK